MLYLKKMLQSMRIIGLLKDLISNWLLIICFNTGVTGRVTLFLTTAMSRFFLQN